MMVSWLSNRSVVHTFIVGALWLSVAAKASSELSVNEPQQTMTHLRQRELAPQYGAVSYRCNENNEVDNTSGPVEIGNPSVRICVEIDRATVLKHVYIMKIANFQFTKKDGSTGKVIRQVAIESGAPALGVETTIQCDPGSSVCAFTAVLHQAFFETDGYVDGIGSVALQDGQRRELVNISLRGGEGGEGKESPSENKNMQQKRRVQDFVGVVAVSMVFEVADGVAGFQADKYTLKERWEDQPAYVQGLCIFAILLLLLLLCCVCAGLILWHRCCADVEGTWKLRERFQQRGNVQVNPPPKAEGSETHSVDDGVDGSFDEPSELSFEVPPPRPSPKKSRSRKENLPMLTDKEMATNNNNHNSNRKSSKKEKPPTTPDLLMLTDKEMAANNNKKSNRKSSNRKLMIENSAVPRSRSSRNKSTATDGAVVVYKSEDATRDAPTSSKKKRRGREEN